MQASRTAQSTPTSTVAGELAAVQERYARRQGDRQRYSLLHRAVMLAHQERQRALAAVLTDFSGADPDRLHLTEVGCGTGMNLVDFVRLGFRPEHLQGVELLPDSAERARAILPPSVRILVGDAVAAVDAVAPLSQDIVYQATVFSSLLDPEFQKRLAEVMWRWVKPGGGVLWYDFTVNNPRNPDVRGVPVRRIAQLFPEGRMTARRLTLAPPIARIAVRIHPICHSLLSRCTWLRTHALVWIEKPRAVE